MTGAVLPKGCDIVIPIEDINIFNGYAELKTNRRASFYKKFIHIQGSDASKGEVILKKAASSFLRK